MIAVHRPQIARRLVPLLDILFLLLAFFIIMPHGMKSVQQQLAAPPDWNKSEVDRLLTLRLDATGKVAFENNFYSLSQLEKRRLVPQGAKVLVILRQAWGARLKDVRALHETLDQKRVVYVVLQEPRK